MDVINSYLKHLAQTPERIDSLLMWTICTLVAWAILYKYRERMIKGMEGINFLFDGGEVVTYIALWMFPPILLYVAFFKDYLIALYIVSAIMIYQITGRYIFDWALAIRTGGKITEPEKTEVKTVTTTTVDQK